MSAFLAAHKPMLICENVPRSTKFYTEILGFRILEQMDDVGANGWVSLERDKVGLMLASPTYLPRTPRIQGRHAQAIHYIFCADIAALHADVLRMGAKPSALRITFYQMKEFDLIDPEGHCLCFGEETDEPPPATPHNPQN